MSNKFYSTNLRASLTTFREALLKGLAPDGGLYMPANLPLLNPGDLEEICGATYPALAAKILGMLIGDEIDRGHLADICSEIYTFSIPLNRVYDNNYLMRLDQGPTASFKDFASLFMGRLMQYFLDIENRHITILTATSGDTGSAVARAFYGLPNINVVILFPLREVTDMQRLQMTTLKGNIRVIAVEGKFDDCQAFAKKAFMDESLAGLMLSSANSINIGRLLPQSIYYFWAWARLSGKAEDRMVFSVPCGNFGNIMGGIIAREMGLPIEKFIIATNENDEVPVYFSTGKYKPLSPSRNCISSAMNVGHPSNFARIIALYGGRMDENGSISDPPDLGRMRQDFFPVMVKEEETRDAIRSCYNHYSVLLEPHGAVAWSGLQRYIEREAPSPEGRYFISLETAHPGKFREEISSILNFTPPLPDSLAGLKGKSEEYVSLPDDYEVFRDFLIKNY
ncbi:MAG: threonine synthase [Bacteroidales bacterium]